ncbi:hypothetical protein TKK_0002898 [Trichogramma kaykai]
MMKLGVAVHLKARREHIAMKILKLTLNFICHIIGLEPNRYPKICLQKLLENRNNNNNKSNWVVQVNSVFFEPMGELNIWENLNLLFSAKAKKSLIRKYAQHLRNNDLERMESSTLINDWIPVRCNADSYLSRNCPLKLKKFMAQLKLINIHSARVILKDASYKFEINCTCNYCKIDNVSILHWLFDCSAFKQEMEEHHIRSCAHSNRLDTEYYMNNPATRDIKLLKEFFIYVVSYSALSQHILKTR